MGLSTAYMTFDLNYVRPTSVGRNGVSNHPKTTETMTVGDLKVLLNQYNDDFLVVLSRDSEGNSFSPCMAHGDGIYVPQTPSEGMCYASSDPDLKEKEDLSRCTRACVLWPIH